MVDSQNKSNSQHAARLLNILALVLLFIVITMIAAVLVVNFAGDEPEQTTVTFWLSIGSMVLLNATLLIAAHGLSKHKPWARYLSTFLACLALIGFPVGTVMGLFILGYLHKGWHEKPVDTAQSALSS